MKDFRQLLEDINQRASGSITVVDYTGLSGKTVTVDGNVLTEGADFDAETSNDVTATNLAAAIDGISGFSASADGDVVTIYFDTAGTGGNAKTLATNDEDNLTLSGETLSGGVAATYTDIFEIYNDKEGADYVDYGAIVTSYSSGNVTITPQVSFDKTTWIDRTSLPAISADTGVESYIPSPKAFVRWKIVLTAEPLTVQINALSQKGEAISTPSQGNKDVATAGTAVPLVSSPIYAKKVYITAKSANAGKLFFGGSGVDEDNGSFIYATNTVEFTNVNLAEIYIDCESGNTDGVQFTYLA